MKSFHSHDVSETKVTCYTAENVECFQSLIEKTLVSGEKGLRVWGMIFLLMLTYLTFPIVQSKKQTFFKQNLPCKEMRFLNLFSHYKGRMKEKMTRPYHFKKYDFPKGIPLQKSNFLKS